MNNRLLSVIRKRKCICWYPSAGSDFRGLLYLSKPFYEKHGELAAEQAALPDLFIMTDYGAKEYFDYSRFRGAARRDNFALLSTGKLAVGTDLIPEDRNTALRVKRCERIFVPGLDARRELIDSEIPSWYGSGYFMTVEVDSHDSGAKALGKWEVDVIYLYAENTAFAKEILLQNHIRTDYILRVRYGGGFGGSLGTDGKWLFHLSEPLKVKYYISSVYKKDDLEFGVERRAEQRGDLRALQYIRGDSDIRLERAELVPLYGRAWYKDEYVVWYKVKRQEIAAHSEGFVPPAE